MILQNTKPAPFTFSLFHDEYCDPGAGICTCSKEERVGMGGRTHVVLMPRDITIPGRAPWRGEPGLSEDLDERVLLVGAVRNARQEGVLRAVAGKARVVEV